MLSRLGALRESSESLVAMGCSQLSGSVLQKKLDSRSKAVEFVPVRCGAPRFKPNMAKTRPLKSPTMLALDHFDFYYAPLFDKRWPSVRLGLLTPNKFVAIVNRFSKDFEASQKVLRNIGTVDIMESIRKTAQESKFTPKQGVLGSEASSSEEEIDEPENVDDEIYEVEEDGTREENEDDLSSRTEAGLSEFRQPTEDYSYHDMKRTKQNETPEALNAKRLVRDSQFKVLGVEGMSADELQMHDHIIEYPEDLCLRMYERSSLSSYPTPMKDEWGMSSWWLLDGASILPVLALDLRETDSVLDMCAAPGGKSMLIAQTRKFSNLVCNDEKLHRLGQLRRALAMYIPNDCEEANKVVIKKKDAGSIEGWDELEVYDKVLVDAPCSNDRLSTALDSTDNMFAAINTAQRLDLPQIQIRLLVNALRSVKVGGSVVYSTCTLSPNQNEAVVENAVALANTYFGIQCVEQSLQRLKINFSSTGMFFFAANRVCKRGILAVPNVLGNFGPMYVCKLKRTR